MAANGGSSGNREVNSIVYQFTSAGQLEVVRRKREGYCCVCCTDVSSTYTGSTDVYTDVCTLIAYIYYVVALVVRILHDILWYCPLTSLCSGSTLYEGGWLVNCSELYPIPILLQLQSIPTMGASDVVSFQTTNGDWYLVIANGRDNTDNPNVDSLVLRWNGTAFQQSQVDFGFK